MPCVLVARSNMHSSPIAHSLDALATWRAVMMRHVDELGCALAGPELADEACALALNALRGRLGSDKLVVAFVAEFSRGKSELINAIFFADAGRRVLPATPGRTTMCPVELRCDAGVAPRLSLLPIETRTQGRTLTELRGSDDCWEHITLDPAQPGSLSQALEAVTQTRRVDLALATHLGLWRPDQPEDNPPQAADGSVEVPAWRHALIQYPHPLLESGLVVIDTPGLNAIGAEPELTLGLLPSAHAVVFVLAADTGATRSDLAVWREHLGTASQERFVVLNKIDTLADPMLPADAVRAQIEQQRLQAAQTLGVTPARVFALSARDALAARLGHDASALAGSRVPLLEQALATELLPRRQALLRQSVTTVLQGLQAAAARRLADARRQHAEQMLELRSLRGKSGTRLRVMLERLQAEVAEFEGCTGRLLALRAVQQRMLRSVLELMSSDVLRAEMLEMQLSTGAWPLKLGRRAAFDSLMARMRRVVAAAAAQADEMSQMLQATFARLNVEFGFAFLLPAVPTLAAQVEELRRIEQNYGGYLALGQLWRMATPGFADQFRRMLLSRLRVVFENAAGEIEMWSRGATSLVEQQLRERRRGHVRRQEALRRVQAAEGGLEQRIAEVQARDERLAEAAELVERHFRDALAAAAALPMATAEPMPLWAAHVLHQDAA